MKKFLSLLLTVVMTLSVLSCLTVLAGAATTDLVVDTEYSVASGETKIFVPEETGYYKFKSSGYGNSQIILYCNDEEIACFSSIDVLGFSGIVYLEAGDEITCSLYNYDSGVCSFTITQTVGLDSISFDLASENIEILENTNGEIRGESIWNDELGEDEWVTYFYYYSPSALWYEGNTITLNYSDGTSEVYTSDEEGFYLSDSSEVLDFEFDSSQSYENQWVAGDNYIDVWVPPFTDIKAQIPVTIIENPYESIEFILEEPIEIIENTKGEMTEDYYWDNETQEGGWVEYFCYNTPSELWNEGNTIIVNYKDDTSDVYTCDDCGDYVNIDGDVLDWDYTTNQSYKNQWTLGSDNYITIECYDKETEVPVTIIENPCESIEFTLAEPIEIVENINGEMREDCYWDEETDEEVCVEFFRYDTPSELWNEGNTIIVNYKDDTSDVYTCDDCGDYVNIDGDVLDWDYTTNQSYKNQWTLGSDNYITIECYGKETEVPVTIIENPCESIEFTLAEPIEIIENTKGEMTEDYYWDNETQEDGWVEFFRYDTPSELWNECNTITVNYKDGTSDVYTCDDCGDYVNIDGDVLDWDYTTNQSYKNQWTVGSDNYITIECYGKETEVPVTIIENPCESIEFTLAEPIEIIENTNGEMTEDYYWDDETEEDVWVEFFRYDTPSELWNECNTITVNYKDGTSDVYTCDDCGDYVNIDGDVLDWDYTTNQSYKNQWTVGSDNYITIECYGKETQVPVTIVESPYDSIEFIPVEPITVEQYTNGYWNSYYDDETGEEETYFEYDVYDLIRSAGNIINIILKDGSKIAYICDGNDYYNSDQESLSLGYRTDCENWTIGGENIITVETLGFSFDISVTLIKNDSVVFDSSFVAEKVSDDTCIITNINVSDDFDGVLNIPETVNGCTVIGIEDGVLRDVDSLTELNLPSTFNMISENVFKYCYSLEAINVAEDNNVFASVNGVLYNKALTEILCIPEAFCGDLVIKAGVTELSDDMISALSNASSVEIEEGNTSFAFEDGILYNADFTKIYKAFSTDADYVMKQTVVEIADYSFQGNETLESVVFAPGVTDITYASFEGCSALESVELPEALVSIGARAFAYNSALTGITLPGTTKTINDGAFRGCGSLAEINLNEGLVSIGEDVFRYAAIDSIVLPGSLTSMGESCFAYCENLSDVTIGSGLTTISPNAFYGCYALEDIDIPKNVTVIDYAFKNTGLKSVVLHDKITSIEGAFSRTQLTSIPKIPKSITSIDSTFSGCSGITVADIPNHIVSMNDAFSYCDNLKDANIPNSVVYMDFAFSSCRKLTDITIPDSVVSIGGAFSECSGLTEVEVPDSVVDMNSAFSGCYNLGTAYVGKGVESMNYAFAGCSNLESVELAEGINCSGDFAFSWCSNLTDINLPSSVTELSYCQFRGCESLDALDIPETLYKVESHALEDTGWYNAQAEGPTYLEHVLYNYKGSMSADYALVVKEGTTSIAESAFLFRNNLVSVELPEGLKYIGDYAFDACSGLKSITIPASVEYIGDYSLGYAYNNRENTVKYDDFIIYGFSGSVAEKYADENGFEFVSIGEAVHSHTPGDWIIDSNASCSTAGSKHKECTECGETIETETIPVKDHTEVKDAAVAATCTTSGKTEGSHCSVCNTVIKAQNTIPAKGHTSSDWIVDKQATCVDNGTMHKECLVCKTKLETETISATGKHTVSSWITDVAATVYSAGSKHTECTVCGEVLETAVIPQLKCATPKLTKAANTVSGIKVTWDAVEGADSYRVYRRAGGVYTWSYIGTTTDTSFTDAKATNNKYWIYTVIAVNEAGYSGFDKVGKTIKCVTAPKVTGVSNVANGLYVKWNAVPGAKEYRVYRKGLNYKTWMYLGTTKNTWFTDSPIKNANGYYYKYTVIAVNDYCSGFYEDCAFTKRLSNPVLKSAVSSKTGITVKWNSVYGSTGYYVYRKTANSGWTLVGSTKGANSATYIDKTAKKGVIYTYTVRAYYGKTLSSYNSGISCKDKY